MTEIKECFNCIYFGRLSDWQAVEFAELIKQENGTGFKEGKPVKSGKSGDSNPILKKMATHGAGFGKVYTVCKKHTIIIPENQASQCQDYEEKKEVKKDDG
jgi:hypothetical protein